MLPSLMIRPRLALPRPPGTPRYNRSACASPSIFDLPQSTSFFSHYYALFCPAQNLNSFPFIFFHALCTKHPGWRIPIFSAASVHGACPDLVAASKSTRAQFPIDSFAADRRSLVHPACPESGREARRAAVPPSPFVTILDAASSISPVFATLTKNMGGGVALPFSRLATASCLSLDWVRT